MKKISALLMAIVMLLMLLLCSCGNADTEQDRTSETENNSEKTDMVSEAEMIANTNNLTNNFVLIQGGSFQMGSPREEAWRSEDETRHTVTVSDFYMSVYELTQAEYQEVMGRIPLIFRREFTCSDCFMA